MNGTCFECKFMRNRTDLEPCEHCTNVFAMTGTHPSFMPRRPLTNADRIRIMTDEELAEFFMQEYECEDSFTCPVPHLCPTSREASCKQCFLDWLRQEVCDGD